MRRSLKLLVSILSHTPFLEFRPIPEIAHINPDAPIILFMGIFFTDNSSNQLFKGGPGGGKTRHAVKIRDEFESRGLAHICVPDLIKDAISRYKDKYPEWEEAARRYERGSFKQSAKIFQLSRRTHP